MNKDELKKLLAEKCKKSINDRIAFLQRSMSEAQNSANAHKGAMESRYDTFKEEAQYLAGGYAKQINEARQELIRANNIPLNINDRIFLGSVVVTTEYDAKNKSFKEIRYFIYSSADTTPIQLGDYKYICISANAPISTAFFGKEAGDEIIFRGRDIEIVEVF